MTKNPHGNPGTPVYGALGGGSRQSANPHGLKTQMMSWLSGININPPQTKPSTKQSVINIPNVYNVGSDIFRSYNRERIGGKNVRRDFRMTGQGIDIAQENLRKKKILMDENLASRGIMGKTREGKPETEWMTEGQQQNINLARVQQHEEKKRWKRGRLHRILFG